MGGGGGLQFVDESGMKRGGTQIKSAPHQHVLFCSVLWAGAGPHHRDLPIQGAPPGNSAIWMRQTPLPNQVSGWSQKRSINSSLLKGAAAGA